MRRALVALASLMVAAVLAASWTAVWLLNEASEARDVRAEADQVATQAIRDDVAELLQEMRDPLADTRRDEMWRRAERIEAKLDRLLEEVGSDRPD